MWVWVLIVEDHDVISIFRYFFLVLETESLKRTGSSLILDALSGMYPKNSAKVLMQLCFWWK